MELSWIESKYQWIASINNAKMSCSYLSPETFPKEGDNIIIISSASGIVSVLIENNIPHGKVNIKTNIQVVTIPYGDTKGKIL